MSEITTHKSSSRSENGIKIIELKGSLDSYNSSDVCDYIKLVLENTTEDTIVLDLSELEFITAYSIGVLMKIIEPIRKDKNVYLNGVNNKIYELFNLLGFSGCCSFISDLSEIGTNTSVFPKTIKCNSCNKKIEAQKSGRFKCPSCKTMISIDKKGNVK